MLGQETSKHPAESYLKELPAFFSNKLFNLFGGCIIWRRRARLPQFFPFEHLLSDSGQDVRVASIGDIENRHPEKTTASGAEINVGARVVVHIGLGQHGVVLDFRLLQSLKETANEAAAMEPPTGDQSTIAHKHVIPYRCVGCDDDELGLALTKGLHGGFVAEADTV